MIIDEALADSIVQWTIEGGDTGWRRVEHRSFSELRFTHHIETGQIAPL
jgi:hypothetical protein